MTSVDTTLFAYLRGKKGLQDAFADFDAANPEVYRLFTRFALDAINHGAKQLSASLIVERIRWEAVMTKREDFRINNNYRAYLARKFMRRNPQYVGIFATRTVKHEHH